MVNTPTIAPQVTIVVVPRERFSYTRESLESIYEHTDFPFKLVYVDGGSPRHIQRYLEEQSREKDFQLIRCDRYLSPNQSRNMGLREVKTKYLVFIDNDVVVTPGWLTRLVNCAEETDAAIVGPLTCIGTPLHEMIHNPGGSTYIKEEPVETGIRRSIYQKSHFANRTVEQMRDKLQRTQCDYAEFHCMLVRTDIFEKTGLLDEGLFSTREHLDFSMMVTRAGGKVYCEREVVVTYVPGPPLQWSDLGFFMLRWSDAWDLASLKRFREKWDLTEDKYFQKRYDQLGFRRKRTIVKPLAKALTFGWRSHRMEQLLIPLEKRLNRYVSDRYARQCQQHPSSEQPLQQQPVLAQKY
ncbi:glycosyltransferase [Desertifilum sp. FACHB-1129]|uniref:Glycosyl transferase family 2 n=1 Tax=Desertifilum tharense IPPAS B-1220 TaxID=1781255 RepID=A0A1E5QH23_9CYAN|nr:MULTISPECIES: glycosyltransferase [Desertifilum]MDA0209566.1 glycosyltransferase [Cyanobacteria bacterium FC1]MBD2312976.1 glycosyltransferase [Desertifilum sp. FACHB-1129]MBD2320978.1 glycosyltransferase [Desertifilum sp. FACHB-866]MBD2331107.1 glycosyltransferase [Desertifilum sp. FACHB-868]OEJ73918.1 glycosyl transferase family 2 [Desertifilum tharense IPPAS B-1220]